ncbi:hypothetical protein SAMN05216249_10479 [Acetitomaculum ruminis DSM 5522]|uniref:Uncharacterized protein n=1 Tax=Acetitomaculum ruminis DSM 5522 TaxID=1120918 RepID=A0A1I0WHD7_9FIRM|nr:hypothetical protein [Acetitomaculum ruminis]SFA88061.1 hypothetical protein SAMN05216249_10479 [Acetitomaculum ruminis DSM 5522]
MKPLPEGILTQKEYDLKKAIKRMDSQGLACFNAWLSGYEAHRAMINRRIKESKKEPQ